MEERVKLWPRILEDKGEVEEPKRESQGSGRGGEGERDASINGRWREERVRMKLSKAKFRIEEKARRGQGWNEPWTAMDKLAKRSRWGAYGSHHQNNVWRNQSVGNFNIRTNTNTSTGRSVISQSQSWSMEDIHGKIQASVANKDIVFTGKVAENEERPEGLPPSQGSKYVGFGSTGTGTQPISKIKSQGDMFADTVSVVSQVLL
ncbi:hypothetical protein NE237_001912 [Protea cynaroides]|uniref:Uncharacterized protein n=1 Tax=Protea cynaroides TaxID=273540 RepID=A0A9Q0KV19_9MAGN|nr:hypothetical protein NE237_001912 [Protea cynaroides]